MIFFCSKTFLSCVYSLIAPLSVNVLIYSSFLVLVSAYLVFFQLKVGTTYDASSSYRCVMRSSLPLHSSRTDTIFSSKSLRPAAADAARWWGVVAVDLVDPVRFVKEFLVLVLLIFFAVIERLGKSKVFIYCWLKFRSIFDGLEERGLVCFTSPVAAHADVFNALWGL